CLPVGIELVRLLLRRARALCGRLQRSMVVRAVEPGAPSAPPAQRPGPAHEQPYQFYPDREAPAAEPAEGQPDQGSHYPDSAWQQPDQPDPYAEQQYTDQGWQTGEQARDSWAAEPEQHPEPAPGDHVYAQQADAAASAPEQPWTGSAHEGYEQEEEPAHDYEAAAGDRPAYGHGEPAYEEPSAGEVQPWQRASEAAYGHAEPELAQPGHRAPEPAGPEPAQPGPGRQPDAWHPSQEPAYTPPEPIYSPSAPVSQGGAYRPYTPPSSRYGGAAANPYAPPYQPDAGDQPRGPSPLRLIALAAAGLLGLFLIGFAVGHILGVGSSPPGPSAPAPGQTTQATGGPTTAPSRTPGPSSTPDQGIVGNARFVRVSSSIPGRCTTSQGCPVQVTVKNNGERGSGSVTVTLSDAAQNGNTVATFTGPIPVTDAGATAQVTGFANGDQLPSYLRSGGTVYITSVDIKSGG
ncbi:MAG TPA: hypothetical protein VLW53_02645, partial [Candidatus Eisenbacteria bacterium]|nr:hypothetical protein [Candidatus Eisenbacteria bacterium]